MLDADSGPKADCCVYKTLEGCVWLGEESQEFRFSIPNFQRLLRLTLRVSEWKGRPRIQILDADYSLKKQAYEPFREQ